MPLQHRHGYAADLHRGLPTGDITQSKSSPDHHTDTALGDVVIGVRAAIQPRSARFELVDLLRGVQPLVPHVRLPVLLAGPGPSGSAGPSRRCQGCFHPRPRPGDPGCPQLHPARYDRPEAVSFHHRTVQQRLVALDVPGPDLARFGGEESGLFRGRWVAWARRSPARPWARRTRCIVDIEHR